MITRQDVLTVLNEPTIKQRADRIMALIGGSEWISVEDRLPEEGTWVLGATYSYSDKYIAKELFLDSRDPLYWLADGDWGKEVTHWMPLPEPPKETPNTSRYRVETTTENDMTIGEQMKNDDRQLIIDIFQAILDVSIDCSKEEIIQLLTNQRDMLERRNKPVMDAATTDGPFLP